MGRIAEIKRETKETSITIKLNLDGTGAAKLEYPIGFMAHMLASFAKHGLFDIEIRATGDLEVDQHHLVEDTGIVLGQCFSQALGDRRGIHRVGSCLFPMDEALVRSAVDISGRPYLVFEDESLLYTGGYPPENPAGSSAELQAEIPGFQVDTVHDFWQAFVSSAGITLHLDVLRARSCHHKIESLFKAAARSLREACEIDPRGSDSIPSTKGVIV